MFTEAKKGIAAHYFDIISLSHEECELRSRCTGHCWIIRSGPDGNCTVYHRHGTRGPYHGHCGTHGVRDALLEIAQHDDYQLNGRHRTVRRTAATALWDSLLSLDDT